MDPFLKFNKLTVIMVMVLLVVTMCVWQGGGSSVSGEEMGLALVMCVREIVEDSI